MSSYTHQEIIWFYISVNEMFTMYIFNTSYHLISKH